MAIVIRRTKDKLKDKNQIIKFLEKLKEAGHNGIEIKELEKEFLEWESLTDTLSDKMDGIMRDDNECLKIGDTILPKCLMRLNERGIEYLDKLKKEKELKEFKKATKKVICCLSKYLELINKS